MTIYSIAQPIETHGKLAGIFPKMISSRISLIVHQATHTLRSAILFPPFCFWEIGAKPRGGVLEFGLDGGVPPGPRDPNPCLEVKKGTHV